MNRKSSEFRLLGVHLAAAIALLAVGVNADDAPLPELRHAGDIGYRSGGVGADEAHAMRADAPRHSLTLIFAARIGGRDAYTAGVDVSVARSDGTQLLNARSDGPIMSFDLPAGTYRITAVSDGRSQTQTVVIAAGVRRQTVFEWPEAGQ